MPRSSVRGSHVRPLRLPAEMYRPNGRSRPKEDPQVADLILTQQELVAVDRTAVSARTADGNVVRVVIPTAMVGTASMWAVLRAAGRGADRRAAALSAREGRTDQEE